MLRRLPRLRGAPSAILCLGLAACGGAPGGPEETPPPAGWLIRGARVADGTGAPLRRADIRIRGDRIVEVAPGLEAGEGEAVVDARGLVAAPGFVDLHSHADAVLLAPAPVRDALLERKIEQGVTTVIVGNCGLGVCPASPAAAPILAGVNAWMTPEGVDAGARDVADYLEAVEASPPPVNVGMLVPHGPLRISAMGLAAGPAPPETRARMAQRLRKALDAGAFGLSAGLIYPPGMFADTGELAELAGVVAEAGGVFTCHVRGSSETLLDATRELLDIARISGARVHHSHLEAVGQAFWSKIDAVLALEDAARAEGLQVSHDVFLYHRAATMMSAIFPPWSLEGGVPALLRRLRDPATRRRIQADIATVRPEWPPWRPGGWPHNLVAAVGWDGILVASLAGRADDPRVGRSLAALARDSGRDPFDVVADLMLETGGRVGQLVADISGSPDDAAPLLAIARHPAAAYVSDAEDYGRGVPHPAHAGAFVRALRWSREGLLPPLEETVRRISRRPAEILGLQDRGIVEPGAAADLVVFDPESVEDAATWEAPRRRARGVPWVFVNGRPVVAQGTYRAGPAGRVLRRRTP